MAHPEPSVSGSSSRPLAPLVCLKRTPAAAATSVKRMPTAAAATARSPGRPHPATSAGAARRLAAARVRKEAKARNRSEEHTSELQSQFHLVCRLLLEKKKKDKNTRIT